MTREQMIEFVIFILKKSSDARQFGGLRREAEMLVEDYLRSKAA